MPSNNFRVRYIASKRIVRVLYLGRAGLEARLQAAHQVVEKFRHLGNLRLLVDSRYAKSRLSVGEQQQWSDFVCGHKVLSRARIAVLTPTGYSAGVLAAEEVARRGPQLRLFLVESEAVDWLLGK